jgi:hypothetical protein
VKGEAYGLKAQKNEVYEKIHQSSSKALNISKAL